MESFLPSSELPFYFISNDGDLLHSYRCYIRIHIFALKISLTKVPDLHERSFMKETGDPVPVPHS